MTEWTRPITGLWRFVRRFETQVLLVVADASTPPDALAQAIDMPQGALNDMLKSNRDWSKSAIVKLCDYFKLKPELFLR